MSFRLKAATLAALSLSALAALIASDPSSAGVSAATPAGATPVILTPSTQQAPRLTTDTGVAFAPAKEVAQPLNVTAPSSLSQAPLSQDSQQSAGSLDDMVTSAVETSDLDDETRCLAGAVYFESKGESLAGQLAVARVVINRARSGRFATSLCGVVFQRGQFSFVRGNAMPSVNQTSRDWRSAVAIARIALDNGWHNPAEGALFFHSRRVSPSWKREKIAAIDNHIFYR